MFRLLLSVAAIGFAAFAAPPAAAAPAPIQTAGSPDQARALELLVRAREAPAVQRAEAALDGAMRSAMARLDPQFANREARTRSHREEVAAAREAGDAAKLNLLAQEADGLRAYFAGLRERAALDPEVIAAKQQHEDAMMARMTELDPEAPALIERVRASLGR